MGYLDTDFKFYSFDQGEVEKMIEIWRHFNPKEEPYPLNSDRIFMNKKNANVGHYDLLFNLCYLVFDNHVKVDRFYRVCLHFRMERPIDYMYRYFMERHKVKQETVVEEPSEEIKEPKKRTKKTK